MAFTFIIFCDIMKKIKGGNYYMYKYELHVHTSECDKCAKSGGAELVKLYADKGYNGMVITDHYFSTFFDWFKDELAFNNHKQIISRWLKGYYAAKNEAEKINFTVLSGAEVRIDGIINDYLIYGLEENDFYRLPLLNRMKNIDAVMDILPEYACVVQAHPFRNNMIICDPKRLFGIETYNAGTEAFRNEMAKIFAEHYKKAKTSGSDCHGEHAVGKGGIMTERFISSSADLVSVLRSQDYSLIQP